MEVTLITATVGLFLVIAFALAAILLRALDGRGFLASVAVGYSILMGGGLGWFLIVAVFFTLGVGFTWYKYGYKKKLGGAQEKGGARNWPNILANGGIPSIFAVVYFFRPDVLVACLFLGSISTAAADTVATELGLLSRMAPRLITNPGRAVQPGTSGGVSPLGFVGAFVASGVIATMASIMALLPSILLAFSVCVLGGVVGALADSVLGASIQRKGLCKVCQKQTEAVNHCGERTSRTGGIPFIENNLVNLMAAAAGALAAGAIVLA